MTDDGAVNTLCVNGTPMVCEVLGSGQANTSYDEDLSPPLTCLHEAPIVSTVPDTVGALCNGDGRDGQDANSGRIIPVHQSEVAGTLKAGAAKCWNDAEGTDNLVVGALTAKGPQAMGAPEVDAGYYLSFKSNMSTPGVQEDVSETLQAANKTAVAFRQNQRDEVSEDEVSSALLAHKSSDTSNMQFGVRQDMAVRRLTPRECERLQGFPDDYTVIPGATDSARYKALGNSMAVPVMRWIGERIQAACASNIREVRWHGD